MLPQSSIQSRGARLRDACILAGSTTAVLGGNTMDALAIVIILALLATAAAMGLGLLAMSGGGATDRDFGTNLMWARVGLQGLTVLLLLVAMVLR